MISLGRFALASVFLLAIWLDPTQPTRHHAEAYTILIAYVIVAAAYLVATWNNWWLENRLSAYAHGLDIALFGVMVFLTEGYTSPFFTFFVFIVLSATIKWGWRETAITAAIVIALFYIGGWASISVGASQLEIMRFLTRGTYLVVLSAVLIWFGINQQNMYLQRAVAFERADTDKLAELPIQEALQYAMSRTGADRAALLWSDEEEPWQEFASLNHDRFVSMKFSPEAFGDVVHPRLSDCVFLFDSEHRRSLMRRDGKVSAVRLEGDVIAAELSRHLGRGAGLAVPIASDSYSGILFAQGIPGLCADDLATGERIGEEISGALQRARTVEVSEEAAASKTRLSFARDLHDSVIQLLAGTNFRLEGIKRSALAGNDISHDVEALQRELVTEQRELRGFIKQLREGERREASAGLCDALRDLLDRMTRQWSASCELVRCPNALQLSPKLEHDLQQLVREGIANAVRHGGASHISISVDVGETGLSLIIADNGSGFNFAGPEGETPKKPWSLNERVHELGGSLSLYSSSNGSRITVSIPFGGRP